MTIKNLYKQKKPIFKITLDNMRLDSRSLHSLQPSNLGFWPRGSLLLPRSRSVYLSDPLAISLDSRSNSRANFARISLNFRSDFGKIFRAKITKNVKVRGSQGGFGNPGQHSRRHFCHPDRAIAPAHAHPHALAHALARSHTRTLARSHARARTRPRARTR